jgi:NAD(P)-dependent dehydrogenase (short-subunit alcohol dehydrogenase family)
MNAADENLTLNLALVTGGSKRLGREIVMGLAKRGYAIGLHYHRSAKEALDLADELEGEGTPVVMLPADLRSTVEVRKIFKKIDDSGFPLEVLVNSAAMMDRKSLTKMSVREWDSLFDLNLRAAWLCSVLAAERMVVGGSIINISDVGAKRAWSGFGAYSVTKAALNSLTMVLAQTLAPNIRVNAVALGLVMPGASISPEAWQDLVQKTPLKRPVDVKAIMNTIAFLLDNGYITGEIINVDGGRQLI